VTTYPADQVATIADPQARQVLTQRGIPDCPAVGFRAAKELRPVAKDPSCVQIGAFGDPEAPVAVRRNDGTVVNFSPWSDTDSALVNTTLPAFVDSLAAIDDIGPFSDDPDVAEDQAARLKPALERIDPQAMDDEEGVWLNMLDEIAAGMYGSSEPR
jgi:hypothetical protein